MDNGLEGTVFIVFSMINTIFFFLAAHLGLDPYFIYFACILFGRMIAAVVFIWCGYKFTKANPLNLLKNAVIVARFAFKCSIIFVIFYWIFGHIVLYSGFVSGGVGFGLSFILILLSIPVITIEGFIFGLIGSFIAKSRGYNRKTI